MGVSTGVLIGFSTGVWTGVSTGVSTGVLTASLSTNPTVLVKEPTIEASQAELPANPMRRFAISEE